MSWYGTCGVSNLPITYGDEVALFILKDFDEEGSQYRSEMGGFTTPDELYNPVVPPVFGKYDDYGTLMDVIDEGDVVLNYFKRVLNEKEQTRSIEDYIKLVERGELNKYNLMLVHKELYEGVIEDLNRYDDWYIGEKPFGKKMKEDIKKFLVQSKEYGKLLDKYTKTPISEVEDIDVRREISKAMHYNHSNDDGNSFKMETQHYLKHLRDYKLYEDVPELKDRMVNFLIFKKAMEFGRKVWSPQSGAGSQATYYGMANLVSDFTEAKIKEYEDYDN